jgi:hypothetical protein
MKRVALLAFVLVAACGTVGVQAHTVALAYKPGDTYKYAFHMVLKFTVGAQGMSIPLDLDMTAKETVAVKSVDSAGTADMSVDVSGMSMKTTVGGTTNTTTTSTTSTFDMKVASDGRIVSVNGSAFANSSLPGMTGSQGGIVSAILPDKAVKPGDTWSKSFTEPSPVGTGSSQVTSDNKYLRDENVGSTATAVIQSKINQTIDIALDASALSGSGATMLPTGAAAGIQGLSLKGTNISDVTSWVDTGARRLVKTHSTSNVDAALTINMAAGATATPGLTGPITLKGTQTLDLTPA